MVEEQLTIKREGNLSKTLFTMPWLVCTLIHLLLALIRDLLVGVSVTVSMA